MDNKKEARYLTERRGAPYDDDDIQWDTIQKVRDDSLSPVMEDQMRDVIHRYPHMAGAEVCAFSFPIGSQAYIFIRHNGRVVSSDFNLFTGSLYDSTLAICSSMDPEKPYRHGEVLL